jgi:hypothetical protein
MLTRHGGEVSDVAALSVEGGTLIVWVDGRDGLSQIYGTIVDHQLRPRVPARPLTSATVSPTGLTLAKTVKGILLAWAESQGGQGQSDIYVLALDPQSTESRYGVRRLLETKEHSHSPELSSYTRADGTSAVMCAWVDTSSEAVSAAAGSRLFWAELTGDGAPIAEPKSSEVNGSVRDFSLACKGDECRSLMTVETQEAGRPKGALWAAVYDSESGPHGRRILGLRASLTTGVTPVIVGDDIFFADVDDSANSWILHRAEIEWSGAASRSSVR